MSIGTVLIIVAIVLVVLIFVLFPEARVLLKGVTRVFIKDMASTPEGAKAIYDEKIDQAREAYSKAKEAMTKATGRLSNTKKKLESLKEMQKQIEKDCETLVKEGKIDHARVKAEEREEVVNDIKRHEQLLIACQEAVDTTTEIHSACDKNLRKLMKEAKDVIENMKTKKQLAEIYNDTDELMASTATDKLLDSIRQKNQELDELAEGSRVVHNAKTSTRLQKAEEAARKSHSTDYLDSLVQKYNK